MASIAVSLGGVGIVSALCGFQLWRTFMTKPGILFEGVWISAAFLRRPVGGLRPHARAEQKSGSFTWSKSEREEVRFLPSAPFLLSVPASIRESWTPNA
jgi:hypothetical protein